MSMIFGRYWHIAFSWCTFAAGWGEREACIGALGIIGTIGKPTGMRFVVKFWWFYSLSQDFQIVSVGRLRKAASAILSDQICSWDFWSSPSNFHSCLSRRTGVDDGCSWIWRILDGFQNVERCEIFGPGPGTCLWFRMLVPFDMQLLVSVSESLVSCYRRDFRTHVTADVWRLSSHIYRIDGVDAQCMLNLKKGWLDLMKHVCWCWRKERLGRLRFRCTQIQMESSIERYIYIFVQCFSLQTWEIKTGWLDPWHGSRT